MKITDFSSFFYKPEINLILLISKEILIYEISFWLILLKKLSTFNRYYYRIVLQWLRKIDAIIQAFIRLLFQILINMMLEQSEPF